MTNCYKCNPNGFFKKSIFYDTRTSLFCFDLHKRPFICIVPKMHYNKISEMSGELLKEMYQDIDKFIIENNIDNYQISYNATNYNISVNKNNHFFIKLKFNPDILIPIRNNHFERILAEENIRIQ
jgi:diadenosine tetraphosphate (Ap4A) HIT family hydrolase